MPSSDVHSHRTGTTLTSEQPKDGNVARALSARRLNVHRLARKPPTDRRADTQRRLLKAGRHIIATHGIGAASVGLICKEAGFSRGAFYSNFSDMDHFVQRVAEQEWKQVLAAIGTSLQASLGRPATAAPDEGENADGDGASNDPAEDAARGTEAAPDGPGSASWLAANLMQSTGPLLDAAPSLLEAPVPSTIGEASLRPNYVEQLTIFARALLDAIPRDRDFYLLWAELANFIVRYPENSVNLRAAFTTFRAGMAQYVVEALDELGLVARIEPADLVDLVIAIGSRSNRVALGESDDRSGELIDRVLPQLLPMLAGPAETPTESPIEPVTET